MRMNSLYWSLGQIEAAHAADYDGNARKLRVYRFHRAENHCARDDANAALGKLRLFERQFFPT